jgi:hypothetical protein
MNEDWINWNKFPVPEDIKGIFIKYEDGFTEADRYDYETKKRKYRDSKIMGWKFMERRDPNKKFVQCSQTPNFSEHT